MPVAHPLPPALDGQGSHGESNENGSVRHNHGRGECAVICMPTKYLQMPELGNDRGNKEVIRGSGVQVRSLGLMNGTDDIGGSEEDMEIEDSVKVSGSSNIRPLLN